MSYVKILHEVDPKEKILKEIGDVSGLQLMNNFVAVVIYQRPDRADLGNGKSLILTEKTTGEDQYQSKVGLVVAKGPAAFQSSSQWVFTGNDDENWLHEWVTIPTAAAGKMMINGVLCCICQDTLIRSKVPDPDMIH